MELCTLERLGVDVCLHYLFISFPSSVYVNVVSIQNVSWENLSDRLERYFLEDKNRRNIFVGLCWCNSAFSGCKADRTYVRFNSSERFQYFILLPLSISEALSTYTQKWQGKCLDSELRQTPANV